MLDVWDRQLSKYGAAVMNMRNGFIKELSVTAGQIHRKITNEKENLEIKYAPNVEFFSDIKEQEEKFYEKIKDAYDGDIRQRTTTKRTP